MQGQTVGTVLEQEHRDIDAGLGRFAEGVPQGEWRSGELATAARALRRHIYLEETLLFPSLRAAGLVAPVMVMVREHGEIWQALDEVEAHDGQRTDRKAALDAYTRLMRLLEAHNGKEEVILYPAADRALDAETDTVLREFLSAGTLPTGWVCEHLRR